MIFGPPNPRPSLRPWKDVESGRFRDTERERHRESDIHAHMQRHATVHCAIY